MIPPLISEAWRPHDIVYIDWDNLLNNFAKLHASLKRRFAGTRIRVADCVTIRKWSSDIVGVQYTLYYEKDNQWFAESTPSLMLTEVFPEDILAKLEGADSEVDITDEIETELATRKSDD